jgi:hypothetical protein
MRRGRSVSGCGICWLTDGRFAPADGRLVPGAVARRGAVSQVRLMSHRSHAVFGTSVLLAALVSPALAAPADTADIQRVMDAFHDAVVHHDGARVAALFIPEGSTWLKVLSDDAYARIKASSPAVSKVAVGSYQDFARFVSSDKRGLDPRHSHVQIHSDGTIASVYFDFVFVIGGVEENRGSETWQLVKGTQGWRIAAITYSSNPPVR